MSPLGPSSCGVFEIISLQEPRQTKNGSSHTKNAAVRRIYQVGGYQSNEQLGRGIF